jgi:hypothetical protein
VRARSLVAGRVQRAVDSKVRRGTGGRHLAEAVDDTDPAREGRHAQVPRTRRNRNPPRATSARNAAYPAKPESPARDIGPQPAARILARGGHLRRRTTP